MDQELTFAHLPYFIESIVGARRLRKPLYNAPWQCAITCMSNHLSKLTMASAANFMLKVVVSKWLSDFYVHWLVLESSLNRLLFNFLEEVLYIFSCDAYMAIGDILITGPIRIDEKGNYSLSGVCRGEPYSRERHLSKTEIKAVTYSNMRIIQDSPDKLVHIYVIFDI